MFNNEWLEFAAGLIVAICVILLMVLGVGFLLAIAMESLPPIPVRIVAQGV